MRSPKHVLIFVPSERPSPQIETEDTPKH